MLKGSQASAQSEIQIVDLMTFVNGRLQRMPGRTPGSP
jgi:hypothetical protein